MTTHSLTAPRCRRTIQSILVCNFNIPQLGAKDVEIEKLLEELRKQQVQYQTLMDTKIALDMEIAVYRRLLESEETRLGLLVDGEGNIFPLLGKGFL